MLYKKIVSLLLLVIACVSISCAEVSYDFTLQDLEGKPISLSDYKGKVVFIDFWATWCPPCRMSIPYVEKLAEKYKDNENVVVLGINLQEDKDTIAKFMKKQKMSYPILLSDKKVVSNYKIRSIPAFYIIDQDGNVYNKHLGFAPGIDELWQKDIEKLLD